MTRMVGPGRGGSGGGGGQRDRRELQVPGEYVIAMVWWKRKQGANQPYLSALFDTFFSTLNLGLETAGSIKRWELLLEGCECDVEIDLDDDRDIRKYMKGKPFKADVVFEQRGQYINADLRRIAPQRDYTDEDRQIQRHWRDNYREGGNSGDPGPSDSDNLGRRTYGGENHWPSGDHGKDPPEDREDGGLTDPSDIPFDWAPSEMVPAGHEAVFQVRRDQAAQRVLQAPGHG